MTEFCQFFNANEVALIPPLLVDLGPTLLKFDIDLAYRGRPAKEGLICLDTSYVPLQRPHCAKFSNAQGAQFTAATSLCGPNRKSELTRRNSCYRRNILIKYRVPVRERGEQVPLLRFVWRGGSGSCAAVRFIQAIRAASWSTAAMPQLRPSDVAI